MSLEQENKSGNRPMTVLRRISDALGWVRGNAHTKKDLINLRRRRWSLLKQKLAERDRNPDDGRTEEPAEPEREERKMAKLTCLVPGQELENVKEDFQNARRVEQYRVSGQAVYIPAGLKWNYLPLTAVKQADESFRVISAGHCVPVREKRPELDLQTETGEVVHISLEKQESMQIILELLKGTKE